jgi:biotin synthase
MAEGSENVNMKEAVTGALMRDLERGNFTRETLTQALRCRDAEQAEMFALARRRRSEHFPGEEVEVRSVIEVSNICQQGCKYCNMGLKSKQEKYTIGYEGLLRLANFIYQKGRRVLLLQSGENNAADFVSHLAQCVHELKRQQPDLAVILCCGNLSQAQYRQLHEAGASRYVLKFETSNAALYGNLKPRDTLRRRLDCLETLLELGYSVGSGNMVGLPGQTLEDMVADLHLLGRYNLAMQSTTVFIPGESSAFRNEPMGDVDAALNMMALMRIMYPGRLIPTTSSLEKGRADGQYWGLVAGANTVTVHDGTPDEVKHLFPIYSTKRFTPQDGHFRQIVERAHLKFAPGVLK